MLQLSTGPRVLAGVVAAVCSLALSSYAQTRPLPDRDTFFREVRKQIRDDRRVMADYTRREILRKQKLDRDGRIVESDVRVFEVFPSLEDGLTYRRLVKVNGIPVPATELAKQDRRHQEKVQQRVRQLQREGSDGNQRRLQREAEEGRKEKSLLNELFKLFDFTIVRREAYDGAPAIVVRFDPKPGVRTRSDLAKWLQKVKGRVWVHETEHEILHVEAEALETISWGWFIARLDSGSGLSFTRRRMADGTWLPVEAKFSGSGRILLLKRFRQESITEFTDYRKLTADTLTSFQLPGEPGP